MRKIYLIVLAVLLTALSACTGDPTVPPIEPLSDAAAETSPAPIADAPDISGAWYDTQTRCMMTVEAAEGGAYRVKISWSSSVSDWTEWQVLVNYDPAAERFCYTDGVKQRVTHDNQGNASTEVLYRNGTGTLFLRDGFLYWTDDLEATRDGSPFTNQIG